MLGSVNVNGRSIVFRVRRVEEKIFEKKNPFFLYANNSEKFHFREKKRC
jgi:hypothetical protein